MNAKQAGVDSTAAQQVFDRRTAAINHDEHASARLQGWWLLLARAAWIAVAVLSLWLFIAAIAPTYDQTLNLTFLKDAAGRGLLHNSFVRLGIPPDWFAAYTITVVVIRTLLSFVIAAVIFSARSNDKMAFFASLFLLTFSVGRMLGVLVDNERYGLLAPTLTAIAYSSFVLFFYVFPNGHFVPAWTRLLMPFWLLIIWLALFFPGSVLDIRKDIPFGSGLAVSLAIATGALAQLYRYRHLSNPVEKQQIKWVVFAGLVVLVLNAAFTLFTLFKPSIEVPSATNSDTAIFLIASSTAVHIQFLLIPISLGIAVLRYRLWNIDIIINRALVYVPLTGILAGLYAALIAMLQRLFQALTGETSDAAVVLTTLILTASFTPIKNALQGFVDKRWKDAPDHEEKMKALGNEVETSIYRIDPSGVARLLLEEAVAAYGAEGGAIFLQQNGQMMQVKATDGWEEEKRTVSVPLETEHQKLGELHLGPRRGDRIYTDDEIEVLQQVASQIAAAIEQAGS